MKFEIGKFYRVTLNPVYPMQERKYIPALVVHKTKRKIVFEQLTRFGCDEKAHKSIYSFHLDVNSDGSEVASCSEKWSMVPLIYPDKPCEKPSIWDEIPSDYKRPKGK